MHIRHPILHDMKYFRNSASIGNNNPVFKYAVMLESEQYVHGWQMIHPNGSKVSIISFYEKITDKEELKKAKEHVKALLDAFYKAYSHCLDYCEEKDNISKIIGMLSKKKAVILGWLYGVNTITCEGLCIVDTERV